MPNFSDQRQFLVKVDGVDGLWAQLAGGDVTLPNVKAYDGGSPTPQVVTANPLVADMTVTRNFDPATCSALVNRMKATLASGTPFRTTITQVPTDAAYKPTGNNGDIWNGTLTGVTTAKMDTIKTGANSATCALTFTCTKLT